MRTTVTLDEKLVKELMEFKVSLFTLDKHFRSISELKFFEPSTP